jgi:hypothetical protein
MKLHALLLTLLTGSIMLQAQDLQELSSEEVREYNAKQLAVLELETRKVGAMIAKEFSADELNVHLRTIKSLGAAIVFNAYRSKFPGAQKDSLLSHAGTLSLPNLPQDGSDIIICNKPNNRLDFTFSLRSPLCYPQDFTNFFLLKSIYAAIENHPCKCELEDTQDIGRTTMHITFDLEKPSDRVILTAAWITPVEKYVSDLHQLLEQVSSRIDLNQQ